MPEKKKPGEVVLDFSGVKPFEPLDPGVVYLVKVTNLTLGTAKSSGDPKVSLEATILAPEEVDAVTLKGEPVGHTTKAAGRKLFREYSLKPEALPFLHEFVKAVKPEAILGESFRFKPADYFGLDFAVKVQNEEYDEQIRPRLKKALPASAFKGS